MTAANAAPLTDEQFNRLAHSLAYVQAVSLIESECLGVVDDCDDVPDMFDLSATRSDTDIDAMIEEAVQYLDARGLLERDATNPNYVNILEESEATR